MDYDEILQSFDDVKYRYEELNDSDVLEAFSLMRDSSSLLASYEQMSADALKLTALTEREAKALEARKSLELSSKVTEGARKALCDHDVNEAYKKLAERVTQQKYIEANARFLSRVYFDSKLIVEQCYKKERPPVGDNKMVGRC